MDIKIHCSRSGSRWIYGISPLIVTYKIGGRWMLKVFNRMIACKIGGKWILKFPFNYGILIHNRSVKLLKSGGI